MGQLRAFLDTAARHRLGAFFHVAAYTAVIAGERIDGTTKSGRTRVVSIDDETITVLRQHKSSQAADQLKRATPGAASRTATCSPPAGANGSTPTRSPR